MKRILLCFVLSCFAGLFAVEASQPRQTLQKCERMMRAKNYEKAYETMVSTRSERLGYVIVNSKKTDMMGFNNRVCSELIRYFYSKKDYYKIRVCVGLCMGYEDRGKDFRCRIGSEYVENLDDDAFRFVIVACPSELDGTRFFVDAAGGLSYGAPPKKRISLDYPAGIYWKWYRNMVWHNGKKELADMYYAQCAATDNLDLTRISNPGLAKVLISGLWLDDDKYFDKLRSYDQNLAMKYVRFCGNMDRYAELISCTRPEEAMAVVHNDAKFLAQHKANLAKWGYTELQYLQERKKYADWDTFYAAMDERVREQNQIQVARQRAEQVERERRKQQTARQQAERAVQDRAVGDQYKPRVVAAMSRDDYREADRLASEALCRMDGGDAYLYYVQAYAYFWQNMALDLAYDVDASAYHEAYSKEAQELARKCDRSIALDSSSGNKAFLYRGIANLWLHRCDAAVADFRKALNTCDKGMCYYNIGTAYANDRQYELAVENMKLAHAHYSDSERKSRCLNRIKEYQGKLMKR